MASLLIVVLQIFIGIAAYLILWVLIQIRKGVNQQAEAIEKLRTQLMTKTRIDA